MQIKIREKETTVEKDIKAWALWPIIVPACLWILLGYFLIEIVIVGLADFLGVE